MKKKPNILVIVTDQQRAATIGALGNPLIKTPVLDGLCERGTAFTRAYTPAPICSPTRVAMATGIEPRRHAKGYDSKHIFNLNLFDPVND